MSANQQLVRHFYERFAARDGVGMAECYTGDARFSDPVFPELQGDEVGDMWKMLCERGKDLSVDAFDIRAEDDVGFAQWTARYTFSATGRPVVNRVRASFRFDSGRIEAHTDSFGLWRWSRQALGGVGVLLGWTPMVRSSIRRQARAALDAYRRSDG